MFSFKFGKNENLYGRGYCGYGLESLLYDAWKGVPVSRSLILTFFSDNIKRGEVPPFQIMEFVAYLAEQAAEPETDPQTLLFPHGKNASRFNWSPATFDAVHFLKNSLPEVSLTDNREIDQGIFLRAAKMEYGPLAGEGKEGSVKHEYYAIKGRIERLKAVSDILKKWYLPPPENERKLGKWKRVNAQMERARAWRLELEDHYKDIKKLG